MMMISFILQSCRSFARQLPHLAARILAEYKRATLAESHFVRLRGSDPAELRRQCVGGPGGISRAVFEALYGSRWDEGTGRVEPHGRAESSRHTPVSPLRKGWLGNHGA